MISIVYLILSSVLALFLLLVIVLIRLIWGDSDAVEIDLREIEGRDLEIS